jgi:diguanylate cyclase (GGDEF)-like protein/PAS domain S-box-containing protein
MSKWYSLHIKNEILLWFFVISIIPLLLISTLYFINLTSAFETHTKRYLSQMLQKKVESTENYIDGIKDDLKFISTIGKTKELFREYNANFTYNKENKNKIESLYFDNIIYKRKHYDLFLINPDGNIIYSHKNESDLYKNLKDVLLSRSGLAWAFDKSRMLLDTEISTFSYYAPSKTQASFIASPIFDEKKLLGIIAIQISPQNLFERIVNYDGLGESGEIVAGYLDNNSNIIAAIPLKYRPNAFNNQLGLQSNSREQNKLPVTKAVYGGNGSNISYDYRDIKIFAAWRYIPSLRWGMVAKIDYEEVMKPIYKQILIQTIVLFFVIILIFAAIMIITKHIVEPIQILTQKVKNLSSDEKYLTTIDTIDVDNEIGALSKSFTQMSKSLSESQKTIRDYATELEKKVELRTEELKNIQIKLLEANKKLQKDLNIIDQYVITSSTDVDGIITEVSSALCLITGYEKAELIGKRHSILRHPDMDKELYIDLWNTITQGKSWRGEIKNQKKDGSFYWVDVVIAPLFDQNGQIEGYHSIRQNISDKKYIEELSIRDQLTQISNRRYLESSFNKELERTKRYNSTFSIILADVDHFKLVNDTYGHDVGDDVLIQIASLLKHNTRSTDIVGRWGGEEFLIICPESTATDTQSVAENLRNKIENFSFDTIGSKSCSFGVSEFKSSDKEYKEVVKRADNALYKAKEEGRNRVVVL